MPTKLKNLKVKRVALVDEGANPDAFVRFAKSKEVKQPEQPAENEQGIMRRALAVIAKALGFDIEKGAHTFAEAAEVRNYDAVMDKEIYPMHWAMMDSIRSILTDTEIDDTTKESLLKQTLAEYSEAYTRAAPSWAKAELTNESVSKGDEDEADETPVLAKIRDHLNELIEKGNCGGGRKRPIKKEDPEETPEKLGKEEITDPEDGSKKPVEKGAIDMIFDTAKMTADELATYNDLAKRFGSEETPVTPAPVNTPQAAPAAGDDDVYKGMTPAAKAELESLRKFRQDYEDRQYIEVAKKYALLGKKPEELAVVLKSLKSAGGSAYDDMIGLLDSSISLLDKSGMFDEIGKRGGTDTGDAWSKIEAHAHEIAKAKPEMSWAQAVDAACEAHPDLVNEYEKSRR